YVRITVGGNDWDDGASWGSGYSAGNRGHVRISMHQIDGSSGILAYTYFPQNGDMVFDAGDATNGNYGSNTNSHRFLRNTAAHEHGHGFGFDHVCSNNSNQLMEPFLSTSFDGPQQDDVRAIQRYYGDINEPDNTAGTAVFAGNLGVGTINLGTVPPPVAGTNDPNTSTLSLEAIGDDDFHRVTTSSILLANFTVTPVGSTYDDSAQNANGSCPGTNSNRNTLAAGDLQFDLIAANGTTVLQSVNAQPAGTAESYTGALLSPAGDFYLKVSKFNAADGQVQLYKVTMTGTSVPTITASDGTSTAHVAVSWTSIPSNSGYQVLRNTVNNIGTATSIVSGLGTNSYNDTTATPGQTYYYWAQAIQGGGGYRTVAGPDTGYRDVSGPPGAFSLSTPADGTVDLPLTPTLTWTSASAATSYTVTLSTNSNLSSPFHVAGGIGSTSYVIPGGVLSDCASFYWGVTATNAGGNTASTPASFYAQTNIPADFNNDGFATGEDFDEFVALFEAGDPGADFNGDTFVSGEDFDEFVQHFVDGC
ncbi:MAG: matrixin family metalloprotease, partial [Dehalococcoidia bacterium]|nr:matrixin family metalloprotease [Dehalococcoidia bacterium]